jgi:hypothetical protein
MYKKWINFKMYLTTAIEPEVINNLNRTVTSNDIEEAVESPQIKNPGPDRFTVLSYQTYKSELVAVFLKIFQEIEKEGGLYLL